MRAVLLLLFALLICSVVGVRLERNPEAEHETFIAVFRKSIDREVAEKYAKTNNAKLFVIGKFKALVGEFQNETLSELLTQDDIFEYIEQDSMFTVQDLQENPPSWGIDRIDQESLPLDQKYYYNSSAGQGVNVYILDAGVYTEHSDFEGRASFGYKVDPSWSDGDNNGHGTHLAGTIAGKLYGAAKKTNVVSVKILSDSGSGPLSGVIEGISWTSENGTPNKDIIVLAIGASYSSSLNAAVASAVESGFAVFVAAGNSASDACNFSPASEPLAMTVSSSDSNDNRHPSSNYGPCVDIFAPGVAIISCWIGAPDAIRALSGTSMATAHVAGVAAIIQGEANHTPGEVYSIIMNMAKWDTIVNPGVGSPNALLFSENVQE